MFPSNVLSKTPTREYKTKGRLTPQKNISKHESSKNLLFVSKSHNIELYSAFPLAVRESLSKFEENIPQGGFDLQGKFAWLGIRDSIFVWPIQSTSWNLITPWELTLDDVTDFLLVKLTSGSGGVGILVLNKNTKKVRYWFDVQAPASYVERTLLLEEGEIVYELTQLNDFHFVAITSSGNLFTIKLRGTSGYNETIEVNSIQKPSEGLLSGLGRKLFWGGSSNNVVVLAMYHFPNSNFLYVLTEENLQQWSVVTDGDLRTIGNYNLKNIIRESLSNEPDEMQLIDIAAFEFTVFVLISTISANIQDYLLIRCSLNSKTDIKVTNSYHIYQPEVHSIGDLKFLFSFPQNTSILYSKTSVVLKKLEDIPSRTNDIVHFDKNIFFGGQVIKGDVIILMSTEHGVVIVKPTAHVSTTPRPIEGIKFQLAQDSSIKQRLKRAFEAYSNNKRVIWDEIWSDDMEASILLLSKDILNALPSSQPTWAQDTTPIQITQQLSQKQDIHARYLQFLQTMQLYEKLSLQGEANLRLHTEKIQAAMFLREYENMLLSKGIDSSDAITTAMRYFAKDIQSNDTASALTSLTMHDICYSQVTMIDGMLLKVEDFLDISFKGSKTSVEHHIVQLHYCNKVFQCILSPLKGESLNFTISEGTIYTQSIQQVIEKQLFIYTIPVMDEVRNVAGEPASLADEKIQTLVQQLAFLVDKLLESFQFTKFPSPQYLQIRDRAIMYLVTIGNPTVAIQLAEKYKAFEPLIQICAKDIARLKHYTHIFRADNFSQTLFKYCISHEMYRELLSGEFADEDGQLKNFLSNYPLYSWVYNIKGPDYIDVAHTLHTLGTSELQNLSRRKTLLSLSKLSSLMTINDTSQDIRKKDDQLLYLIKVMENFGIEAEGVKAPETLIKILLNQSPLALNDIVQALDIYKNANLYVSDHSIMIQIWETAFYLINWGSLAEEWIRGNVSDTQIQDLIQQTLLYQAAATPAVKGLLTTEILKKIIEGYRTPSNPTLTRLFDTLIQSIQSIK